MARDNRRRRIIVEGFQTRFVVVQLLWVVGALIVFAGAVLGPLVYSLLTAGPSVSTAVADQFLLLHGTLWPVLVGLIALLGVVFVHMSFRVAGPLYRFRLAFREIAAGRLDVVVKTRPTDYLKQEEDELNAMIGALRARVQESQTAVAELDQLMTDRRADPSQPTHADIEMLHARVRSVAASLSRFIVGGRGFTLIELLIAVSIMMIVTGLAVPTYLSALDAARVARATGDIHAIQQDVMIHLVRVGCMPGSLAEIGRDTLLDPWGKPYAYGVIGKAPGNARWDSDPGAGPNLAERGSLRVERAIYYGPQEPTRLLVRQGGRGNGGGGNGGGGGGNGGGGNGGGGNGGGGNGGGGNGGGGNGGGGNGGGPSASCGACQGSCLGAGALRKDRRLMPLNHDFDLYSLGKDGVSKQQITSKDSLDDVIRASNGGFIGLAKAY